MILKGDADCQHASPFRGLYSPEVRGGRGRLGATARLAGAGRPPQWRVVEPLDPVEPWPDP
jgi:hypothetical protein